MPSDVIEPGKAAPGPGPEANVPAPAEPSDRAERPRALNSNSGDELSLFLTSARPDPMLGEFVEGGAPPPPEPAPERAAEPSTSAPREPAPKPTPVSGPVVGGSFDRLTGDAVQPRPRTSPSLGDTADALSALALDTSVNLLDSTTSSTSRASLPALDEADQEDETEEPEDRPGVSWAFLLLASYASAVTIGLAWVLLSGRRLAETTTPETSTVETGADLGRRANHSRRIVAADRNPSGRSDSRAPRHVVGLGETLQVGLLEVTPLQVSQGRVDLERLLDPNVRKVGGTGALKLRVRLRNRSDDVVLAPLDEAYLREREPGTVDSYVEDDRGKVAIEMYPLAVDSEWSIVGQDFRDLKPGESYETLIVSAPGAAVTQSASMTWRLRLRSGINQTDQIGVRFGAADVREDQPGGTPGAPRK